MKAAKIILKSLIILILLALFSVVAIRFIVINRTSEKLTDYPANADAIVVLGAGVHEDGTPSPMLKNRLDKAVELWNRAVAMRVVVSGDHRLGEYDEVDVMAQYLIAHGVPENRIRFDYEGFSTLESIRNLSEQYRGKNIILITQEYHLYRSLYLAEAFGIHAAGAPAENAGALYGKIYRSVRECIATTKDFLSVWLNGK